MGFVQRGNVSLKFFVKVGAQRLPDHVAGLEAALAQKLIQRRKGVWER
jgi:hypothetical protein